MSLLILTALSDGIGTRSPGWGRLPCLCYRGWLPMSISQPIAYSNILHFIYNIRGYIIINPAKDQKCTNSNHLQYKKSTSATQPRPATPTSSPFKPTCASNPLPRPPSPSLQPSPSPLTTCTFYSLAQRDRAILRTPCAPSGRLS